MDIIDAIIAGGRRRLGVIAVEHPRQKLGAIASGQAQVHKAPDWFEYGGLDIPRRIRQQSVTFQRIGGGDDRKLDRLPLLDKELF